MNSQILKSSNFIYKGLDFEVLYKLNSRAKRINIKVNQKKQVIVTVPRKLYLGSAQKFLIKNSSWVEDALAKFNNSVIDENSIAEGLQLYLVGELYLSLKFDLRVKNFLIDKANKVLLVNPANTKKNIKLFYKSMAEQIFKSRVDFYAQKVGVEYSRISIKDQSTRWGSCSSRKVLSFSWRVVMAPKEVIDYLVLHEVCHLKYMDHSKNFWGLVENVMPNYKKYDKWLRVNGYVLKGFLN